MERLPRGRPENCWSLHSWKDRGKTKNEIGRDGGESKHVAGHHREIDGWNQPGNGHMT